MEKVLDRERLVSEKKKIALMSILLNFFLSVTKITAGIIGGSSSLVADGIHSLADLAGAVSVYVGIVIANFKSDKFPYGLYKVENLVALISAFAIFFAGFEIVKEVLLEGKVRHVENLSLVLFAVVLTIVLTFLFSRWERKKGEELNSPSLIADAQHIKTDMFSSVIVLVGILGNYFGFPIIEKVAVLFIVALVFHAGLEIALDALKVLLDATIDKETLDEVKEIVQSHPLVGEVKSITGRSSGGYKFIELELILKTDNFEKAHEIVHQIEEEVKRKVPFIERLLVHFEPPQEGEKIFAVLLTDDGKPCKDPLKCRKVELYSYDGKDLKKLGSLTLEKPLTLERGSCANFVENLACKKVKCLLLGKNFFGKGALYVIAYYNIELGEIDNLQNLENSLKTCIPAEEILKNGC
ncbi:MAG: cation transporter [Gammaproteobacteria bacterium]|nr:MAG: cation transporter [Gammaproteobacteria bacterium]